MGWFLVILVAAALCPAPAAAGSAIPRTVAALRAIQVEDLETEVPAAARPLLSTLKRELKELAVTAITATERRDWEPTRLQAALHEALEAQGIRLDRDRSLDGYGGIHELRVEQPDGFPDLLVVLTQVGINCGHDRSLYLFQRTGNGWALRLALEAGPYRRINGAQSHLGYLLLPSRKPGAITLAIAEIPSWCTSNWRTIRYRILYLGPEARRPTVLLDRSASAVLGEEAIYRLSSLADGFSLSWYNGNSLEPGLRRARLVRYRVDGGKAIRLPAPAPSPQDFLDDWLALPWGEAASLSPPSAHAVLRKWHGTLGAALRKECGTGIAFVQTCPPAQDRWQIGLTLSPEGCPMRLPSTLYATVERRGETFLLQGIAERRPPGCPGESEPVEYVGEQGYTLP